MCTDQEDIASLSGDVLDAHVVVVSYGGDGVRIVYDAHAEIPGLEAAVGDIGSLEPEDVRARLLAGGLEPPLDPIEAEALGKLDVAMVDALEAGEEARRAVLAGYVLVALRQALRAADAGLLQP